MKLKKMAWPAFLGLGVLLQSDIVLAQSGTVTDDAFASSNATTQLLNLKGQGISLIVAGSSATVGSTSVGLTKSYIKFQLQSSLPPNVAAANVQKATLKLFLSPSFIPGGAIDIYPVTSAWTESTLNPSLPPTVTASPFASDVVIGNDMTFVVVDVTQLVQDWIEGPSNGGLANDGIALVAHTGSTYAVFDSKESIITSHEPRLEIVLANSGPQGTAGPQGPQGPVGPQGTAGTPGSAATVQVGTTMTVAAGTPASVLNGGTANAALLNFLIPQGLAGATGATGPQGPAGINNRGQWASANAYNPNDAVSDQGSFWLALQAIPGSTPNSEPSLTNANWQLLAGGIVNRGTWSASNNYNVNDAVSDGGSFWLALVPTSAAATPSTSCEPSVAACAADWQLLAAQGAQGAQGQTGAQGPQGIQGLMGFQGPPGVPPPNSAVTNINNNFTAPQTVGGNVSITGSGNGLVFPDGTVQTSAATSGGSGGGTISCSTFEISSASPITPPGYAALGQTTAGNVWFTVAPIPTARFGTAAASSQGKIYVIGGVLCKGPNCSLFSTVEVYDPTANSWAKAASMPTARKLLAAAADAQGNIYAIGGIDNTGILTTVEKYNPTTNTWSTLPSLSTARVGLAAAADSTGKIYAIGGSDAFSNPLGTVEVYDPTANAWSTTASLPLARFSLGAATGATGKIYAIGGVTSVNTSDGQSEMDAYDPTTQTWQQVFSMPTARSQLAVAADSAGKIYAIGGLNTSGFIVGTVEVYDSVANTWTTAASLPTPTTEPVAAGDAQGRIYAINVGGSTGMVQYSPPVTIYTFIKN